MEPQPSLVPPDRVDVLIVAAHAPDLRGVRGVLGDRMSGTVGGLHVVAKTIGVGMPVAGGSTAKRAFQLAPRAIIQIGTAGVYPGLLDYRPCSVVVASKVLLVDHSVLGGHARFPDPMQTEFKPHAMVSAGLAAAAPQGRPAPIASTLATTIDDGFARAISSQVGCHIENLEAFSVAHACHLAQIPYAAVFAITHVIGPNAANDWRLNEKQAATAAADAVLGWLQTGAQGLPHG